MIAWDAVTVDYDGTRALGPVSIQVGRIEWLGVIGPNGSGKSTLLKTALRLVDHGGAVTIGGSRPRPGADVAWMPQRPSLPDEMGVADYVMLGRTPHLGYLSSAGPRDRAAVDDAIAKLELSGFADRALGTLSGGEAQRVVLARALAQEAPVLLLDEPTSSIDVGHAVEVLELLDRLRLEEGLTIVTALHDLTLAGRFADRLVLLSAGTVVADGAPGDVLTEPLLTAHYGAGIRVTGHEDGPNVLPRRRRDD